MIVEAVTSFVVIKYFDVIKYITTSILLRGVDFSLDLFPFQQLEKLPATALLAASSWSTAITFASPGLKAVNVQRACRLSRSHSRKLISSRTTSLVSLPIPLASHRRIDQDGCHRR